MRQRLEAWFKRGGWQPADFQRRVWELMEQGASGLLHSPTGSGKSLAVAFGALLVPAQTGRGILWITPLRSLAADLASSLAEAFDGVGAGWRVGLWSGDVPASRKRALRRSLPEVLVTTPESLAVMISRAEISGRLGGYAVAVVDEWHELAGSKRGVLLQLGLARLAALNPAQLRWGLSATLGNPCEAAEVLGGFLPNGEPRPMNVVRGPSAKPVQIEAVMPEAGVRLPRAGHLGLALADSVAARIQEEGPALVFTNTRSQAELWHQALAARLPPARLGLHHSSLDESLRTAAERGLREGTLDAVVATSSLDLGCLLYTSP
ncbi:MAG: DEAD/DEAH box helicase, partial [Terrimicrobiaceae bacterium]|nr:DEAD/DEAH box helicase [Terrimicrobiaceae bacterium]